MAPPKGEELLTRFLIYRTDDEGHTLSLVGEQLAKGSEEALRKYFDSPPTADAEGDFVAISENHCKIRPIRARVRTTVGEAKTTAPLPAEQTALA